MARAIFLDLTTMSRAKLFLDFESFAESATRRLIVIVHCFGHPSPFFANFGGNPAKFPRNQRASIDNGERPRRERQLKGYVAPIEPGGMPPTVRIKEVPEKNLPFTVDGKSVIGHCWRLKKDSSSTATIGVPSSKCELFGELKGAETQSEIDVFQCRKPVCHLHRRRQWV